MKSRSLAGNVAVGIFVLAFVFVVLAFFSASWLVSDYRILGAKVDRLGLWTHCFRSLPDPRDEYKRRFYVGCRWIFDPFTTGYDRIRGYLVPAFMVVVQFFYTLAFLGTLGCGVLVLMFVLCCSPDQKRFTQLTLVVGAVTTGAASSCKPYIFMMEVTEEKLIVFSRAKMVRHNFACHLEGVCAAIAVITFALFGNQDNWMPGHENNFFGWSFGVAIASIFALLGAGALFLVETNIQMKKRKYMKESQTHFEMNVETKA